MKYRILLTLLLVVAAVVPSNAQKEQFNPVSTAVNSLKIGPDARSGGMGDIGAATEPDANSQAWNPAKYPFALMNTHFFQICAQLAGKRYRTHTQG